MCEWQEYCTVCGGPPYSGFYEMAAEAAEGQPPLPPQAPPPNPADYKWLESFIGISNKEELIPLATYDLYGDFAIDIQPDAVSPYSAYSHFAVGCHNEDYVDETPARGYACHFACYNLLQQELNYTLKHADLLPLLVDNEFQVNKFSWSDYGGLAEYQDEFFSDEQLVKDGKLWMIEDPSRNAQDKERILQLWRPLLESGFKRPEDARVGGAGSLAPEIAKMNLDASEA